MNAPALKIDRIHHVAYRCRDAEEMVEFYTKMRNVDFVLATAKYHVPSTHEPDPYMHLFLDAGSGNLRAFFELPARPEMGRDPNTPVWVQHIALKVKGRDTPMAYKSHLEAKGVDALGVTDHSALHSICCPKRTQDSGLHQPLAVLPGRVSGRLRATNAERLDQEGGDR